jgi:hypothetical protein
LNATRINQIPNVAASKNTISQMLFASMQLSGTTMPSRFSTNTFPNLYYARFDSNNIIGSLPNVTAITHPNLVLFYMNSNNFT